MVAITITTLIVAAILFDVVVYRVRQHVKTHRRRNGLDKSQPDNSAIGCFTSLKISQGFFHHRGHTWMQLRQDGTVVVGINDLLHRVVGKIDEIRLPKVGGRFSQGEKAILLIKGDNALYLTSPVTGTVIDININIGGNPEKLKDDPYGEGWIIAMSPDDLEEDLHKLMVAIRAEEWVKREEMRIRIFFEDLIKQGAVMKKSDEPATMEGILERFGNDEWVHFKDLFIYQCEWRT